MSSHPSYRHVQPFTALWLLLPLIALVVVVASFGTDAWRVPGAVVALAVSLSVPPALLLLLGRLVIELRGDRLHWSFGFVGWPRWSVALADIAGTEVTRPRAIQGAGIKGFRDHRLYNVTMGGPALRLVLRDGRTITLGTPEPKRLAGFLAARMPAA